MDDIPICTNSYRTEVFDNVDSSAKGNIRGSLHGPVKIFTQDEIDEANRRLEIQREIDESNRHFNKAK